MLNMIVPTQTPLSGHEGIETEINNRMTVENFLNMWKLNHPLLNNSQAKESLKKNSLKYIKPNEKKNRTYHNLCFERNLAQ